MERFVREPGRGRDDGSAARRLENLADRDWRGPAREEMNKVDVLVDRGANRLQQLSRQAAAGGGVKAKLAETLAEDAAFLRKLKPSLMVARARGEAPTDQEPGSDVVAPSVPQHGKRARKSGGGPHPLLVVVAAGAAGVLLAKLIDWRGHAHPRD